MSIRCKREDCFGYFVKGVGKCHVLKDVPDCGANCPFYKNNNAIDQDEINRSIARYARKHAK